jgi:hypothetical protein
LGEQNTKLRSEEKKKEERKKKERKKKHLLRHASTAKTKT